MRLEELLPCPFCGGYAEFERMGGPRHSCIVACSDCGCRLETSEIHPNSGKRWNERSAQTKLAVLLREYANDMRRNSSGSDDYPWNWAKATADYLEILIERAVVNQQLKEPQ